MTGFGYTNYLALLLSVDLSRLGFLGSITFCDWIGRVLTSSFFVGSGLGGAGSSARLRLLGAGAIPENKRSSTSF